MKDFISQQHSLEQDLITFQYLLLRRILLLVSLLSFLIASSSLLGFYPLGTMYMNLLYVYSMSMSILYYAYLKHPEYYVYYVQGVIFFSILVLLVMTTTLWIDTFRLVWFFLVVFSAFILQGRDYGVVISFVILLMVTVLFSLFDLHFSIYAFITFLVSLSAFTLFGYYFMTKLQLDEAHFKKRVKIEVEKQQSQEQLLLRQYRMANMGEMIDAIAHQWRQPLMQSNMLLLNMEEELDNRVYLEKKMQELISLNTHMSQTIDDFRYLLHDIKHQVRFDIQETISEVLALMQYQLKDIDVVRPFQEDYEILGYKNELTQVLITLFSNAVEALNTKGIDDKKIMITTSMEENILQLSVEDNAGGINPLDIEKIFDPYFSTKKSSGGSGLGLYIAKMIVEETMQGSLSVLSGEEGAKFTIALRVEK